MPVFIMICVVIQLIFLGSIMPSDDTRSFFEKIEYNYKIPSSYILLAKLLIVLFSPILVASSPFIFVVWLTVRLVGDFKAFKSSIVTLIKDKIND